MLVVVESARTRVQPLTHTHSHTHTHTLSLSSVAGQLVVSMTVGERAATPASRVMLKRTLSNPAGLACATGLNGTHGIV